MRNKYRAQSVYYHLDLKRALTSSEANYHINPKRSLKAQGILYFPSRYEYKVYQELIALFGIENVVCQASVLLYPFTQCCPNGRYWNIDFLVKVGKKPIFVEAKGALTERFLDSLIALEVFNPDVFNSLYLLFDKNIPTNNKIISNLIKAKSNCQIMLLRDFIESQTRQLNKIKVAH